MDGARQERRASPLLRTARVRPTLGRFTLTSVWRCRTPARVLGDAARPHLMVRRVVRAALPEVQGTRLGRWRTLLPCYGDVLAKAADTAPG